MNFFNWEWMGKAFLTFALIITLGAIGFNVWLNLRQEKAFTAGNLRDFETARAHNALQAKVQPTVDWWEQTQREKYLTQLSKKKKR